MNKQVYKQNTGVLTQNQNILKRATVTFLVDEIVLNDTGFSYCYSRCNGKYRFNINMDEVGGSFKILPSTACYKIKIFIDSSYVYKDNGSIVLDLSNIIGNNIMFEIEIDKGQTILFSRIVDTEINNKLIEIK